MWTWYDYRVQAFREMHPLVSLMTRWESRNMKGLDPTDFNEKSKRRRPVRTLAIEMCMRGLSRQEHGSVPMEGVAGNNLHRVLVARNVSGIRQMVVCT